MTSAVASTDLAVGVRRVATHKNTRRYDIIDGPEFGRFGKTYILILNPAGQTSERQQLDGSVAGRGMTAQNDVCTVFLCVGTHHGFSWLPGNKSKNNTMYITRQAWGWAVSVSGVLFY